MPILPENKQRYPKDWDAISVLIREDAQQRCEGSPGFYPDCRAQNHLPHPVTGSEVVLTVAHLDHIPEHNERVAILRAMCQRCHNTYDASHRSETRRKWTHADQLELF